MSLALLQEKLQRLPESCFDELYDFMAFRVRQKTGLDQAIAEVKRGEYEVFPSFEELKVRWKMTRELRVTKSFKRDYKKLSQEEKLYQNPWQLHLNSYLLSNQLSYK